MENSPPAKAGFPRDRGLHESAAHTVPSPSALSRRAHGYGKCTTFPLAWVWVRIESGIRKRINHDGSTVYEVRVRRKGMPERTLTWPTLREARKHRDMARSLAWEGKHTQGAEGRRKTVAELCEAFLTVRYGDRPDHSHYRSHRGHLRWWCERIGEYRLAYITPQMLLPYCEQLLKQVTPTT